MKSSLALFVLFLVLAPSAFAANALRGTNPLLRFIAEVRVLREYALYTLLENRCERYMKNSEQESCFEAVDQKITLLDFDILLGSDKKTPVLLNKTNPTSYVFVAFKKDLLRLLSDPKTEKYLRTINEELSRYLSGQKKEVPNVWNLSVAFYGSEFEASRAIAVLFQDTSSVKLHLAYLEVSGVQGTTPSFDPNREFLGRTIDTMNMVLDANGGNFQELFYPKNLPPSLHRTIYHFFVPNYLAMALEKKGVPKRFAFIAPFMLTLTYECITASEDYRYLFDDPERLVYGDANDDWKVGDLYTGYNGALFGTKQIDRVLPLETVRRAFDVSTLLGVQTLLK